MEKMKVFKTVKDVVITVGVSAIVGGVAKDATDEETSGFRRFCISMGALALGGYLSEKVNTYIDGKIDKTVAETKEAIEEAEKKAE